MTEHTRRYFLGTRLAGCACSISYASVPGQLAPVDNAFQIRPTHLYKPDGDELRSLAIDGTSVKVSLKPFEVSTIRVLLKIGPEGA